MTLSLRDIPTASNTSTAEVRLPDEEHLWRAKLNGREFNTCERHQDPTQVQAMRKQLSLLHPLQDKVFQCVPLGCRPKTGPWFANVPMAHNTLSDMMPQRSVRADLSRRYTNHCVRASVIMDLKDAVYANREVCAGTDYKNKGSTNPTTAWTGQARTVADLQKWPTFWTEKLSRPHIEPRPRWSNMHSLPNPGS